MEYQSATSYAAEHARRAAGPPGGRYQDYLQDAHASNIIDARRHKPDQRRPASAAPRQAKPAQAHMPLNGLIEALSGKVLQLAELVAVNAVQQQEEQTRTQRVVQGLGNRLGRMEALLQGKPAPAAARAAAVPLTAAPAAPAPLPQRTAPAPVAAAAVAKHRPAKAKPAASLVPANNAISSGLQQQLDMLAAEHQQRLQSLIAAYVQEPSKQSSAPAAAAITQPQRRRSRSTSPPSSPRGHQDPVPAAPHAAQHSAPGSELVPSQRRTWTARRMGQEEVAGSEDGTAASRLAGLHGQWTDFMHQAVEDSSEALLRATAAVLQQQQELSAELLEQFSQHLEQLEAGLQAGPPLGPSAVSQSSQQEPAGADALLPCPLLSDGDIDAYALPMPGRSVSAPPARPAASPARRRPSTSWMNDEPWIPPGISQYRLSPGYSNLREARHVTARLSSTMLSSYEGSEAGGNVDTGSKSREYLATVLQELQRESEQVEPDAAAAHQPEAGRTRTALPSAAAAAAAVPVAPQTSSGGSESLDDAASQQARLNRLYQELKSLQAGMGGRRRR